MATYLAPRGIKVNAVEQCRKDLVGMIWYDICHKAQLKMSAFDPFVITHSSIRVATFLVGILGAMIDSELLLYQNGAISYQDSKSYDKVDYLNNELDQWRI